MEYLVSYHLPDKRVSYQINTDLVLQVLIEADLGKISVLDPHDRCRVRSAKISFVKVTEDVFTVPDNCIIFAAFYQDINLFLDICGPSQNRKIVSVWHGIPLRRINLLDTTESRQPVFQKAKQKKNFLFHLVSSDHINKVTVASWEANPENVITIGNIRSVAEQKDISWPHSPEDRVAVFCPSNAVGEVFSSVSDRLGLTTSDDELNTLLQRNSITLYHKAHGQASTIDIPSWSNIRHIPQEVLDFHSVELNNLFSQIDLMVSDCSSLMVDFLDYGKPVIFSLPTEQYLSRHAFNFDTQLLHGQCPTTATELVTGMVAKLGNEALDEGSVLLKRSLGSLETQDVKIKLLSAIKKISLMD